MWSNGYPRGSQVSLDDRDWYRDEVRKRERWQHPLGSASHGPEDGDSRNLLIATWIVVIAACVGVSIAANKWRQPIETTVLKPQPQQPRMLGIEPESKAPASPTLPIGPPETRKVAKCVVNGNVTYSATTTCHGGRFTSFGVDPARSEAEGGFSAYELEMLESADARARLVGTASTTPGVIGSQRVGVRNQAECGALVQEIESLDEHSRDPLSAREQDLIRYERNRATRRQFDLTC